MADHIVFEQPVTLRASGFPQDGDREGFQQVIDHLRGFIGDLPAGVTAPQVDPEDKRSVAGLVSYSENNIAVVEYCLSFTLKAMVDTDAAWDTACEAAQETGDNPDDVFTSVAESAARDMIAAASNGYDIHIGADDKLRYVGFE